ncbi:hypothetical protein AB0L75_44300, partial [Streptomyces sp. NPDC052101]
NAWSLWALSYYPHPYRYLPEASRGGLTTKSHLVCDGKGRVLAFVVSGGQVADTSMLATMMEQISVPGARGRPRARPDRLNVDKGCPSKANRAIDFGEDQR